MHSRPLALAIIALASSAATQADRYELGKRLIRLEAAAAENPERRSLAEPIGDALKHFFGLDIPGASRALDDAWLRSRFGKEAIPDSTRWAASLGVATNARLFDGAVDSIHVELDAVYDCELPIPRDASFRVGFVGADTGVTTPIGSLPLACRLPVGDAAEGDHELRWTITTDAGEVITRRMTISVARELDSRLEALDHAIAALERDSLERSTARAALRTCRSLTRSRAPETDLPGARLLREAEAAVACAAQGDRYYGSDRPGEFWLRVPADGRSVACRVLVPRSDPAEPPPLVIALHGAGGSENLFFDGEGGLVPQACASRGWLLVAPRSTPVGTPDLPTLLDAIATRYAFDAKRVYLIGHSMGAMQAIANARRAPTRFAAVAALGGGGRIEAGDAISGVAFQVTVGSLDFARGPARALALALERNEADVEFVEVPDVGHVLVLQDALPRVFAWLDAPSKR